MKVQIKMRNSLSNQFCRCLHTANLKSSLSSLHAPKSKLPNNALMVLESLQQQPHTHTSQACGSVRGMWLSIKSRVSAARNRTEPPGCSYWLQSRLTFPWGIPQANRLNGRQGRRGQFNHKQSHWGEGKMSKR